MVILGLFALNLGVYAISNQKRKTSVEALRRAISSQILIADVNLRLNDKQKQIAMLNQAITESGAGASSADVANFVSQMDEIRSKVKALEALSGPEIRAAVSAFGTEFDSLANSWVAFYRNFGVNYSVAITELALRGDPISQHLLQQTVPQLLESEKKRVDETSATYYAVGSVADRLAIFIFLASGVTSIFVAVRLSKHVARGLKDLHVGAAMVGSGNYEYQIPIASADELAQVAVTFNHMSTQLRVARDELTRASVELEKRHVEMEKQKAVSDSLLLNILPSQIADELRAKDFVDPKYFEDVTILFTDFVGFSNSTRNLSAEDLVYLLHDYFTAFDNISTRYGLEKLKTIGDSYMCVGGMPARTSSHPVDTVMAAFEMVEAVKARRDKGPGWGVRVGVHTGPVIAGVVGIRKFAFDVWGESVNLSSRMESSGSENCINISQQTYLRVKDFFACESRGHILTKDDIAHEMYFVRDILPSLAGQGVPPELFSKRYGIYFQRQPPAFPAALANAPAAC
jgi:class 3 adenylate cyclase